jgi:hypothetical protein
MLKYTHGVPHGPYANPPIQVPNQDACRRRPIKPDGLPGPAGRRWGRQDLPKILMLWTLTWKVPDESGGSKVNQTIR